MLWYQFKAQNKSLSSFRSSWPWTCPLPWRKISTWTVPLCVPGLQGSQKIDQEMELKGYSYLVSHSISASQSIQLLFMVTWGCLSGANMMKLLGKWLFIKLNKLEQTQHHNRNYHSFREGLQKISLVVFTAFLFISMTSLNINVILCHGLAPGGNKTPHSSLLAPLPEQDEGKRMGRAKVRKFMGWEKNSLIIEIK